MMGESQNKRQRFSEEASISRGSLSGHSGPGSGGDTLAPWTAQLWLLDPPPSTSPFPPPFPVISFP